MKQQLVLFALLLSLVEAQKFIGSSPRKSFATVSEDMSAWTETAKIGAILGFSVYIFMYIFTVIYLAFDIRKSYVEYAAMVEDDLRQLEDLGIDITSYDADLKKYLSGTFGEDGVDDQLLGEAQKMDLSVY